MVDLLGGWFIMSRISKQQSSSDEPKKTRRQRRSEMSPEKREFLRNFVGMYDIKTAADLQDAVKDLLGDTIKDMLEEEMNEHLGYEKYKHSDNPDSRNGYKSKEIMSSAGSITIDVPQDRDSAFEPKVVKKGHYKPPARSAFKNILSRRSMRGRLP